MWYCNTIFLKHIVVNLPSLIQMLQGQSHNPSLYNRVTVTFLNYLELRLTVSVLGQNFPLLLDLDYIQPYYSDPRHPLVNLKV